MSYHSRLMFAVLFLASLLVGLGTADNPVVQTIYTADPAPIEHDGRLWLFTGHDEDGSTNFDMRDWHLFSTDDMANWQHHGVVMSLATFSWANERAWAGQVVARNGRFYYYVPVSKADGAMAIGVGVADAISGPYLDALGHPLVDNTEIDPTIFIDDDGQAYLYWGNPNLFYVLLNEDMISYSGDIQQVELTAESFGARSNHPTRTTMYEEGPWLHKRGDLYYMSFAADCCQENLQYSTGPSPTGPWTYRGIIMDREGSAFTNHGGIIQFQGQDYLFYHNGALPGGGGFTRSVCVEALFYNEDGTIQQVQMSRSGPAQIRSLDPYIQHEAETISWSQGIETEVSGEGTLNIWSINNDDYIKVQGVEFGAGAVSFSARVASALNGGTIELRLDALTGQLVGICIVPGTGGWQAYVTVSCDITNANGLHDLYFVFKGEDSLGLFNFNWWQFRAT
ncbi:unnamed protein product [Clonostachys rosea f. rosea IK726]|uniref:CBM6 domain-containing protein n=2 Tax=Bionectria ochroleuca TaxID=29856 RepID=A0A0B7KP59_BIOOC|nr:unnamed protein product [Clonostachys rosea f. rosea IK726]